MIAEPRHRSARNPNVQNDHLARIHRNGRQIVRILFVPGETQQRNMSRILVDNCRMLQMTQIEHPHRTVSTDRREHIATAAGPRERNIVDLLVVRNQLRLDVADDHATDRLARFDAPDRAGGVDRRGAHQIRVHFVPVERRQRRTEIAVLVVVEDTFEPGVRFAGPPNAEVVAAGGQQIGEDAFRVGNPHDLGGRVGMVEGAVSGRRGGEGGNKIIKNIIMVIMVINVFLIIK